MSKASITGLIIAILGIVFMILSFSGITGKVIHIGEYVLKDSTVSIWGVASVVIGLIIFKLAHDKD